MHAVDVVRRLQSYRAWVNRQLLTSARALTAEELRRPFEIGQGSVWSSLVHLFGADRLWLDAFTAHDATPFTRDDEFDGLDALTTAWSDVERGWDALLDALHEDDLARTVVRFDRTGNRVTVEALDAHLQLCTHAAYTAAQVVNMMRHLGVHPLPSTMLLEQARAEGRVVVAPLIAGTGS
jgi:uncharacterized damage-inducible protein DinB